jgi:hypothetical protein
MQELTQSEVSEVSGGVPILLLVRVGVSLYFYMNNAK